MIKFFKTIWKYINVFIIFAAIIFGTIGIVLITIFFKKGKSNVDLGKNYIQKMEDLLKEKLKNEETISNSDYSNYNDNGTIKPRKKSG